MPNSHDSLLIRYQYDALDRLVSCTPSGRSRVDRLYQKDRLTTEIQGSVQRQIFQCADMLLAELQQEEETRRTSLLMTDKQHSVLQTTDSKSAYTPYGHRPVEGGLASLLGFNGEHPDPVTGHYLLGNGHRAFNPVLMRFNSLDSLSPFGKGGLNGYAYCQGDPVNRIDPTGKYWQGWTWFGMGVADFVGSYLLPHLPRVAPLQRAAQRIPVVGRTGFGQASKGIATISGLAATVLFPVMTAFEIKNPESSANDRFMLAMAALSAVAFISGAGVVLHKLARPATVLSRTSSLAQLPAPRLTRSQSQPNIGHNFGSESPMPVSNTNLDKFNLMKRFDQGEFRSGSGVVQNSTSIRRNSRQETLRRRSLSA